jgi:tRNA(fMet)-specific endonuclease VapC
VLFLLDTNAISALMREDPRMASWLSATQLDDRVVTCAIVRGEILFGLEKLAPGQRRAALEMKAQRVIATMPCEAVTSAAADRYATVKLVQQQLGLSLDENDLWIAATALALGATVVSLDSDFQRVEALRVVVP